MKRSTEDILLDLEVKINSKMREVNNILYPDIRKAPQLTSMLTIATPSIHQMMMVQELSLKG